MTPKSKFNERFGEVQIWSGDFETFYVLSRELFPDATSALNIFRDFDDGCECISEEDLEEEWIRYGFPPEHLREGDNTLTIWWGPVLCTSRGAKPVWMLDASILRDRARRTE